MPHPATWRLSALMLATAVALGFGFSPREASVTPAGTACANSPLQHPDDLTDCIGSEDVLRHLRAFQAIADANGGNRTSGAPGYDASAEYVADRLTRAGLRVERQRFTFSRFTEVSASLALADEAINTHAATFSGSGAVVDGKVIAVDLQLGAGNASSSACEAADFEPLDFSGSRDIALIQRGGCTFAAKAIRAADAGAEAIIIFNQGDTDARTEIIGASLTERVVDTVTVPVLDVSYADGVRLVDAGDVTVTTETHIETHEAENVIADLPGVRQDRVVMAGAHLDSVADGPGMNDNGSGSAVLLTIALTLAADEGDRLENTLRFAWWGAEESGLVGSNHYVFDPAVGLTDEEHGALTAYVNLDMIASPNFIYGVYDADESSFEATGPVPEGSAALEGLFEAYYSAHDIPYTAVEFSGRSDYRAFVNADVPSAGLFTGAQRIKTDEQVAIWGGVSGVPFDHCYHASCDTIDNISIEALDVNLDAIASVIFQLAQSP